MHSAVVPVDTAADTDAVVVVVVVVEVMVALVLEALVRVDVTTRCIRRCRA